MAAKQTAVSSRGRTYNKVDYTGSDAPSPTKSKSKTSGSSLALSFTNNVNNALGDAISNGYKPHLGSKYLITSGNKLVNRGNEWRLEGMYISETASGALQTTSTTRHVDTQPKPLIIEILAAVKDLTPERDISNTLFNDLTKSLHLPSNYLKFQVGDNVLLRPNATYKRGKVFYFEPVEAVVTSVLPHATLGNLSAEYEVSVVPNIAGIRGGAVYEANLRQTNWSPSDADKFETCVEDHLVYEAERALDHGIYNYLEDCGLDTESIPYLNVNSAFFNNKKEYYSYYASIDPKVDGSVYTRRMLLNFANNKIKEIISSVLMDMKPAQTSKLIQFKARNDLRKYGKTMKQK